MQNNFWNKTSVIIGILGIIVAIIVGIWTNREKTISLNILKFNETLLTKPLDIDGLTVSYMYNDSINVDSLWKTTYVIKNTGNGTIYGDGFLERNTRTGRIPFTISNCKKVLCVNIDQSNNGAYLCGLYEICVSQWRPGEYVEITLITEGNNLPNLKISDREIKDSQITYSLYTNDEKEQKKSIVKYFPKIITDIIKWMVIFVIIPFDIIFCYSIPRQIKESPKDYRWVTIILMIILFIIFISPILWIFEI